MKIIERFLKMEWKYILSEYLNMLSDEHLGNLVWHWHEKTPIFCGKPSVKTGWWDRNSGYS